MWGYAVLHVVALLRLTLLEIVYNLDMEQDIY